MNTPRHFVPHKRVVAFFALVALALFVYGFFIYKDAKMQKKEEEPKKEVVKVAFVDEKKEENPLLLDTDSDGAYDWVERLYPELDPENPDSDGDGVLDGKYIQKMTQINERKGKIPEGEDLSQSEKLGRSLYSALMLVYQNGGELDEKEKKQISENVASYIKDLSLGSKEYIRNELNLVPDTKENSFAYRDAMLAFYKKYPVKTSDLTLIIKATQDPENFKPELETAALKYDEYIHELSTMKVPYLVASRHNELINAAGQIEGALKNLTLDDERDDIVSLSSLVQIEKTIGRLVDANIHIKKYFDIISEKGIFPEDKP